ncbi:acyltransferase [Microbacterium sp. Root61]|nr:acyltransferase [Microbacterium sp. Root61]
MSTHLTTRWDRLNGPSRVAGIDLARGLAVVGMFAAHLLWIEEFDVTDAATWLGIVHGRSSILFATLAGVSIGLVTGGRTPLTGAPGHVARGRLAVRAGLLWVLGLLLIATGVPVYVILPAYAILFLLALPLTPLGARVLLMIAAALAIVMPFFYVWLDGLLWSFSEGALIDASIGWHYPFPVWLAFVVAGMGLARLGIRDVRVQFGALVVGAGLAILGYGLAFLTGADTSGEPASYWEAIWTARSHSSGLLEVIGSGGFAIGVIGACLLLCRTVVTWVVLPIRAVGSMPLTAYTVQILAWAVAAIVVLGDPTDLVGFRDLAPFWPLTLLTIAGCTAWALLIGRGPLEWALDKAARFVVPSRTRRIPQ